MLLTTGDPYWPRASAWLAGEFVPSPSGGLAVNRIGRRSEAASRARSGRPADGRSEAGRGLRTVEICASLSAGLTNGNPVRALLADGLPGRNIVQIGVQLFTNSQAHAQVANDAEIAVVAMSRIRAHGVKRLLTESLEDLSERVEHIYVDLDMDSLAPRWWRASQVERRSLNDLD